MGATGNRDADHISGSSGNGRGLVLGVGSAGPAAGQFAALTNRTAATVPGLADVRAALKSAVGHTSTLIMLPRRSVTFEAANALIGYGCDLGQPIGLVPLDDQASRYLPRQEGRPFPHRVAIYSDFLDRPTAALPMFGRSGSADFLRWLRDGTEAVVMHVHGNGADFRVGTDVLCVQVGPGRPRPGQPGEKHLPCQSAGPCRLDHKVSFQAFHGPAAVRSRLLVLLSCAAFHPADGLLDSRFVFIEALLRREHVQGVVTSMRINFGALELGVAAAASLDASRPLGEIAMRINGMSGYGPPSYLCLGDPELRLAGPPAMTSPLAATPAAATSTAVRSGAGQGARRLAAELLEALGTDGRRELRGLLRAAALGDSGYAGPGGHAAGRCLQAIMVWRAVMAGDYPQAAGAELTDALARAADAGPAAGAAAGDALDLRLCSFFGAVLSRRGPDAHDYLGPLVAQGPQVAVGDRHDCGARLVRSPLRPRWLDEADRWLYTCERCGTIANQRAGARAPRWAAPGGRGELVLDLPGAGGWQVSSVAPIGGHPERPTPPRPLVAGKAVLRVPVRLPGAGQGGLRQGGLRRWAVAAVRAGDYAIVQHPLEQARPRCPA